MQKQHRNALRVAAFLPVQGVQVVHSQAAAAVGLNRREQGVADGVHGSLRIGVSSDCQVVFLWLPAYQSFPIATINQLENSNWIKQLIVANIQSVLIESFYQSVVSNHRSSS